MEYVQVAIIDIEAKTNVSFCDCVWQHQEPEKISWFKKIINWFK
jgi:hypothetical protein